jgi:hypothetical protein
VVRGPVQGREHIVLFWLRLPLSQDGICVDRILCYDTAAPIKMVREVAEPPLRHCSAPEPQMWTARRRAHCA